MYFHLNSEDSFVTALDFSKYEWVFFNKIKN